MSDTVQYRAFVILLGIVSIAFLWLIWPFYGAILWAVVLAVLFHPMHGWLLARLNGRRSIAALVSVLTCILVAIIPMVLLAGSIVQEGRAVYSRISSEGFEPATYAQALYSRLPTEVQGWLDGLGASNISEQITSAFAQAGQMIAGRAWSFGQGTLGFFVAAGLMIYLLFFLFRDGDRITQAIRHAMPLKPDHTDAVLNRFISVVRATVKGNFIIAAIQGLIGGLAFWALGVNGAILWGTIMAFLSLLPAVGAAIVWVPVAVHFFLTGQYVQGAILVFVGVAVIGLVDNILRPPLVGKETRLPDYMVLFSTVGGLAILGINGFIIGPLIAALFVTMWSLFSEERRQQTITDAGGRPLRR
ncbi:AI-2E family transporter [Aureimonas frigidaquae]|uniref:AI-2E family transporter n=1 Tax=Aureimonas frigidaquae TaxID=424757 RepID=UPI0007804503|nr:AI-2E family transporter [Aureimonas frigidaquae]